MTNCAQRCLSQHLTDALPHPLDTLKISLFSPPSSPWVLGANRDGHPHRDPPGHRKSTSRTTSPRANFNFRYALASPTVFPLSLRIRNVGSRPNRVFAITAGRLSLPISDQRTSRHSRTGNPALTPSQESSAGKNPGGRFSKSAWPAQRSRSATGRRSLRCPADPPRPRRAPRPQTICSAPAIHGHHSRRLTKPPGPAMAGRRGWCHPANHWAPFPRRRTTHHPQPHANHLARSHATLHPRHHLVVAARFQRPGAPIHRLAPRSQRHQLPVRRRSQGRDPAEMRPLQPAKLHRSRAQGQMAGQSHAQNRYRRTRPGNRRHRPNRRPLRRR